MVAQLCESITVSFFFFGTDSPRSKLVKYPLLISNMHKYVSVLFEVFYKHFHVTRLLVTISYFHFAFCFQTPKDHPDNVILYQAVSFSITTLVSYMNYRTLFVSFCFQMHYQIKYFFQIQELEVIIKEADKATGKSKVPRIVKQFNLLPFFFCRTLNTTFFIFSAIEFVLQRSYVFLGGRRTQRSFGESASAHLSWFPQKQEWHGTYLLFPPFLSNISTSFIFLS